MLLSRLAKHREAVFFASLAFSTSNPCFSSALTVPLTSSVSRRCHPSTNNARRDFTVMAKAPMSTVTPFSDRVMETLDPCVVLMKQMIAEYAHLWEEKGGIFSLAQGVVYWEPPPTVSEAINDAMKHPAQSQLHTYCPDEGLPELREALVDKLERENALSHHDVMITSGANQAFVNCVLTLLSQGDKCVVFRPYYFNHVMAVQMTQGNKGLVIGSCSNQGIPDVDWLDKTLADDTHIRMVTVVNPGNPTGVSLKRDELQRIVDTCGKRGVWLVLDCTYEHFDHADDNKLADASQFPGFSEEHVIHIFSFSKGHALAGFRCGYIVISRESDVGQRAFQEMLKVQDTIPICPARISQVAALGALKAGRLWVKNQVSTLDTGRGAILEAMSPMEIIMGGSGAMYVMGKLNDGIDDQVCSKSSVSTLYLVLTPN